MKINYKLEVEYQVFEKGRTFFETKSYIYNSDGSLKNRKDVINKYASFKHVFELASETTNDIKLSITEVINKNISGFKIPSLNIYYSKNKFTPKNTGTVLFGDNLFGFNERINSLKKERNLYKTHHIPGLRTENLEDYKGRVFKVLNNSPFTEKDFCKFKNIMTVDGVCV